VVEDGERFIAGRINDFSVLVVLEGDHPFHVGERETWSRRPGLVVEDFRFQVDPTSAVAARLLDLPLGALVLSERGASLIAGDRNGPKAVLLAGGEGSTDLDAAGGDAAFTVWRIVTGEGDSLAIHFQHSD
jgi:hypothetical protein